MFSGTTPARNAHHEPVDDGASAAAASTPAPTPGLTHRPMRMPAMTEISDVAANHSSVDTARRAALVTLRRFATDVMTAVTTSGGTISFSSCTYAPPTESSTARRPEPSPVPRAMKPRMRPMIRP